MSDAIKNGFTARQAVNGGWIVSAVTQQHEFRVDLAAFSSPADMLSWLLRELVTEPYEENRRELYDAVLNSAKKSAEALPEPEPNEPFDPDRIPTDIGDGAGPL